MESIVLGMVVDNRMHYSRRTGLESSIAPFPFLGLLMGKPTGFQWTELACLFGIISSRLKHTLLVAHYELGVRFIEEERLGNG